MENNKNDNYLIEILHENKVDGYLNKEFNIIKRYIEISKGEMIFLYEIIQKFKPKKLLEIGIFKGGSSALILNSIKNIEGAKLYSIDKAKHCYKDKTKESGYIVNELFPHLLNKWNKYTGNITSKFIEKIGGGIEFAFIDTSHILPGEVLEFLQILPFLKEEAVIVLHDTNLVFSKWIKKKLTKTSYSNNKLLVNIRGKLIMPFKNRFSNMAGVKLDRNQKNYYYQYFLLLNEQWEYIPENNELNQISYLFKKYYGNDLTNIFLQTIKNNEKFLNSVGVNKEIKYFNDLYKT